MHFHLVMEEEEMRSILSTSYEAVGGSVSTTRFTMCRSA